jgi:hypothetical protein
MKALGFLLVFFGWLMSMNGYTAEHVLMIVVGFLMVTGGYYIDKR